MTTETWGPFPFACEGGGGEVTPFARVDENNITFPIRREGVDVEVTLQVSLDNGVLVCGLRRITGTISLPPRALRAAFKEELAKVEKVAIDAGCGETRHAGRLLRLLDDYEPFPALPDGVRKRL